VSIRAAFVERFGEEEALRLERAAHAHAQPRPPKGIGSDPFKWVLLITIAYECFTRESFRAHHGIVASVADLKEWIKSHGGLDTHDGDVDYLALVAGAYNEYMPAEAA
jgi:hypothetical protein